MSIYLAEKVLSEMNLEQHVKDAIKEAIHYNSYAYKVEKLLSESVVEEVAHEKVLKEYADDYIRQQFMNEEAC